MRTAIFILLNVFFLNWAMANGAGLNIDKKLTHYGPTQMEETREKMRENPRNRAMGGSFSQISSHEEKEEEVTTELKRPGNQVWR